jgi:hypothetical protein
LADTLSQKEIVGSDRARFAVRHSKHELEVLVWIGDVHRDRRQGRIFPKGRKEIWSKNADKKFQSTGVDPLDNEFKIRLGHKAVEARHAS